MGRKWLLLAIGCWVWSGGFGATLGCASDNGSTPPGFGGTGGIGGADGGSGGSGLPMPDPAGSGSLGGRGGTGGDGDGSDCGKTCAELGWACGYAVDSCGDIIDCADEGLVCQDYELCLSNAEGITECVGEPQAACDVCDAVVDCSEQAQPTRLTGRVLTPGRTDDDAANQVGVPNAVVYILRRDHPDALPEVPTGIPQDGTACERCEDMELGPVLTGAVTDATGHFSLEGDIPIDRDFLLVVRAGKFRRVVQRRLPTEAACATTALPTSLPQNPLRLPRSMEDGLAAHLPRIAVTTGEIDAMECVFEKMGIAHAEFGNPGSPARVHLYRGGPNFGSPPGAGARIDDSTPHDTQLYGSLARMRDYDMIVADCEGLAWDSNYSQRNQNGANVREFVNRGGRMFASHHSFSWLHENGSASYDPNNPLATGLAGAAQWQGSLDLTASGTGRISLGRPLASPQVDSFATWMESEQVAAAPDYTFGLVEPRSQATSLGSASEEFVYLQGGNGRVQQFSFNTPYGAPEDAACGRVAYSGFHVAADGGINPFLDAYFPHHCTESLTDQEKVLLYMLFDLGACVGDPPEPPVCMPDTCDSEPNRCGFIPDRCGGLLDCGPCVLPPS